MAYSLGTKVWQSSM